MDREDDANAKAAELNQKNKINKIENMKTE